MKPGSKKKLNDQEILFNYHFSRERRVTGNVTGIWIDRYKIFADRPELTPDKASVVVMTTLKLHNLLRSNLRGSYTPKGSVDEIKSNGHSFKKNSVDVLH